MPDPSVGQLGGWYNRTIGRARRQMDSWPMFRLGYITALEDVERTGLQPRRDAEKIKCAERAFHRYVEDGPGA